MMPLPSGDFFWDEHPETFIQRNPWANWSHESKLGYFLEVDIKYPNELHCK